MRREPCFTFVGLSLLSTFITGCGGGGGGSPSPPTASTPTPIIMDHPAAAGDTFSKSGTAWDIVDVKTTLYGVSDNPNPSAYTYLKVDVTFAQDVSSALPLPGQALTLGSQLGVGITISDSPSANANTAAFSCLTQSIQNYDFDSSGSPRLADDNYGILNSGGINVSQPGNVTTEAQTTVTGNVFSQTFRLGVIGVAETATAPLLGVAVNTANGNAIPSISFFTETDCVPRQVEEYFTK